MFCSQDVGKCAVEVLRQEINAELLVDMPAGLQKRLSGFSQKRAAWLRARAREHFGLLPEPDQLL